MKVSVLMSFIYRPQTLLRTLQSWKSQNYADLQFVFCDNGSENPQVALDLIHSLELPIENYYRNEKPLCPQRCWNQMIKPCQGEYVIIAMQDEILSSVDTVSRMLDCSYWLPHGRISLRTYELSKEMTESLDTINWKDDPKLVERIPDFWTHPDCHNAGIKEHDASLIMHVTSQSKSNWEYLGYFREEEGYLLMDRDVHLREALLGIPVITPDDVYCYHQWHKRGIPVSLLHGPSFRYETKEQAQLKEPAIQD